jgi:hypothetical protein
MNTLEKIGTFLQQGTTAFQPSPDRFPPIDAKRLEDDLQLVQRAQERGRDEQPPSSAECIDVVEQELLHQVKDQAERARSLVMRELKGYAGRLAANNLATKAFEIRTTARDAAADFSVAVKEGANRLALHLERVRNMHTERAAFREKNHLQRPAEEPVSTMLATTLILLVGVIETALNTNFFAVGNDAGLLGGLVESFLVTLFNVGLGFYVGKFWWPYKNHLRPLYKGLALCGVVVHFLASVAWNLFVTQYRLALQNVNSFDPGAEALRNFIQKPLHVEDFQSVMMIILGVGSALLAAYEAYKMRDRYPHYSKMERDFKSSADRYAHYQHLVIQDLKDIKDQAIRTLSSLKDDIPQARMEVETILATKEHLMQEYSDYISHLGRVAEGLITTYRDLNSKERATPRPSYFDSPPTLDLSERISEQAELAIDMSEQAAHAKSAAQNLDQASEEIFAEFRNVQARFPLLEDIFKEPTT